MRMFVQSSYLPRILQNKLNRFTVVARNYSSFDKADDVTSDVPYESSIHKNNKSFTLSKALPSEADVVVIGAGSVGCSTAYHLSKLYGSKVVLLEKDKITSGTTWHTAGILWSYRTSKDETMMQLQTRELISEILPKETGEDAGWLKTGTIGTTKTAESFKDVMQNAIFAKACGVETYPLKAHEINDLHPLLNVNDVYGAVYSPGDGTMDPATYCMAYLKVAQKHGAKVFENCAVVNITTAENDLGQKKVVNVVTDQGTIKTDRVVNCAGAWSPYIGQMIGVRIPQLTFKHAYVVTKSIPGIRNTPIVKDHGSVYIRPQGEALLFGGYEANAHLVESLPKDFAFGLYDLDWDIFDQHTEAAMNRIPAIADVGIRSTVCGPESFTVDGKPNMGESVEVRGFFIGSGFNSGGMMLGGGAGRQLAHWVYHGRPELDLINCDIRRYPVQFTNHNKWLLEKCHENFAKRYSVAYKYDHSLGGRNQRKGTLHEIHASQGALFGCKAGCERPAYYVTNDKGIAQARLNVLEYDFYGNYGYQRHNLYEYHEQVLKDCTYEFPEESHRLIGQECLTCRTSAVLFDSSHMAKYCLTGPDAEKAITRLLSRDMTRYPDGRFVYALMLNKAGGIESDVVCTRIRNNNGEPGYYITGASSAYQFIDSHMQQLIYDESLRCNVENFTEQRAILSLQGPKSASLLQPLIDTFSLDDLKYGDWKGASVAGKPVIVARLSFVGELGFECHCDSKHTKVVYEAIMQDADKHEVRPAGYRALDSLSTEIGFHHWPHTISRGDNPVQARLTKLCDQSRAYLGSEEIYKLREQPLSKKLACFTVDTDVPLYGHEIIWRNDEIVGYLSTADYAYALGCNIGFGYVKLPSISDQLILEGNYKIERMGECYPTKAHISSPFDPSFKRMTGKYSAWEQNMLLSALQNM
ncbi:sarcosine dehydrogenase, mitochondrial-like [Clavelina lepadiformis]|uniref:sarcosine dehydrogenase, mitochondrial-like n=1 Tax=Clavelina lepadiformis TaxID=159417 RepID=UPI004042A0DE